MKKLEEFLEWGGVKKDVTFLILSGIALLASLLNIELFHVDLAWVAIILCGIPIILEAIIGLVTKFDIKADVLVSLALIASVIIGEIFAAGEVAFIMQLGGLLEDLTVAKARAGIEKLVHLTPRTARRISDEKETIIPAEQVQIGDTLRVLPGETIPVDGTILSGQTSINQAVMTGESLPVDKGAGDSVSSGTVNQFGSFDMKATKVGDDSSIQRMIKLVQSVDADKAKIVGIADRWATWIVVIALSAAALTWLISGQIIRAVTILVVFCPCALVLATPTAIMAAIGNATKHGFLVREGDALERLAEVSKITFDKTGTLTQDKVVLEYHLNLTGEEDDRVLRHAFLNSYFQTGLKNLIDLAVLEKQQELGAEELTGRYAKVDEIPFDFERRRMSVVVRDRKGKTQLVTKGAVEEMLSCCSYAQWGDRVLPLEDKVRRLAQEQADRLNQQGMRVIAVAQKTNPAPVGQFSVKDERNMVLLGFLALLDPPKDTSRAAVQALQEHGVAVKILTGDNEKVTQAICRQVGLDADHILLGSDLDGLTDQELGQCAEKVAVFAKLSPDQKARVVKVLRDKGHSVGYMGDGINDAAALKAADVGISVDTAVDIARESASVVLLEKDLMVLEQGVIEGRKTYANMMKYIKMTASSNFGNMFSVLAASAFLPFLPMASIHLILLNLIYDISCTAMSWDNVDPEYLKAPRKWEAKGIGRFMLWMGPTSSVFDIATYLLLYFVVCPLATGGQLYPQLTDPAAQALYVALFQTGWFVESMWTQTLVIHMLRTEKLPFVQSRASVPVALLSLAGIALVTAIPFTPLAAPLEMAALPPVYFLLLGILVAGYMLLVTAVKNVYVRRYGQWL